MTKFQMGIKRSVFAILEFLSVSEGIKGEAISQNNFFPTAGNKPSCTSV